MTKRKNPVEMTLSPSGINTFFSCERLFYYNYILGERAPPNIHLYKGSFIHKAIENLFKNTKYVDLDKYIEEVMTTWNPSDKFFSPEDDKEYHKTDAKLILEAFARHIDKKLDMVLFEGKVNGENHAWNRIRPHLQEQRIKDDELNIQGIIDSVQTNFDEKVYIIDYKTSKLYKEMISEDYIRQVNIYAYLYFKEHGRFPDFVGVNYLRYGELYFMPVKFVEDKIIENVKKDVDHIRNKIASTLNKEDYPMCTNTWCDHHFHEKEYGKS